MGSLPSTLGPYRVVRLLGEGGMGAVYEAVHEAIERRVAIKVLHSQYSHHPDITARFFNEARAVNRIDHPGLVQVSDFGQIPDGTGYIVMEFLKGDSLAQRLKREGGSLCPSEAVHLAAQIADSLAAAHEKGIVHRDLKPENVMIVGDSQTATGERTKLLDFGIAKLTEDSAPLAVRTKTNALMGTPTYMSPEQCAGAGRVDAKTDVYALGIMLFEMLAGKPPFVAEGMGLIISMHLYEPPPRLRDVVPSVPPAMSELVGRLLVKSRDERPSMRDVHRRLTALAQKLPAPRRTQDSSTTPVQLEGIGSEALVQGSTLTQAAAQAGNHGTARQFRKLSFGAVVLVAILASAIWAGQRMRSPPLHAASSLPAIIQSQSLPKPPLIPQANPEPSAPIARSEAVQADNPLPDAASAPSLVMVLPARPAQSLAPIVPDMSASIPPKSEARKDNPTKAPVPAHNAVTQEPFDSPAIKDKPRAPQTKPDKPRINYLDVD